VPLHPAAADVPGARPPRQGLPELALAAARLLAAEVRRTVAIPPNAGAGRPPASIFSVSHSRILSPYLASSSTVNIACAGSKNPMLLFGERTQKP